MSKENSHKKRVEITKDLIMYYGSDPEIYKKVADRRTGRTTGLAFETISKAMANRGEDIPILDHFALGVKSDKHLVGVIRNILTKLNLDAWEIRFEKGNYFLSMYEIGPLSHPEAVKEGLL